MASKYAPIFSEREEDSECRDELDEFVVTLSERVDSLQDAEANSDLDQVESLARDLGDRALRLGYPSLAEVAGQAAQACVEGKNETVRGALEELTEVARRVRQGHRGAA